jgi:molybdate transport system substrate-binding protein
VTGRTLTVAGVAAVAVLVAVVVLVASGGSGASGTGPTVYAASSLRGAFPAIDDAATYSFAGSNTLRLQIERGAPADVFASAEPAEAQALFRAGRCDRPVTFASNRLVLIVPADGDVRSLADLRAGGRRLAVGSEGVPVGTYTRALLRRLGLSGLLEANAVSQEKDVASITAKVALGSADAGFVYHSDALSSAARTREIALPAGAQPDIGYDICAVRREGADAEGARAFIDAVRSPAGRAALSRLGFGPPA